MLVRSPRVSGLKPEEALLHGYRGTPAGCDVYRENVLRDGTPAGCDAYSEIVLRARIQRGAMSVARSRSAKVIGAHSTPLGCGVAMDAFSINIQLLTELYAENPQSVMSQSCVGNPHRLQSPVLFQL